MVDRSRLIRLLQKLISIDSQNPDSTEERIARFAADYLSKLGLKPRLVEFKKGRSNLIVTLKGGGKGKRGSLLISPHLDTVPAGSSWSFPPFAGTLSGGRIYGLGSTDCKGNLACAIEVMNSLIEDKRELAFDLILAATADEESGSGQGLIPLLKKDILRPDAALILDADDFAIVITQKGLVHLRVKIKGKKAHGAYPWLGRNAINIAVDILKDLKETRFKARKNNYLRAPTVNIGTIRGGDKVNVVADHCEFELDFRFLPGQSDKEILKGLRKLVRKYSRDFKIELDGVQAPYYIGETHPLVRYLKGSMKKCGIKPEVKGSEGATVITFFQEKGIPAIATGFGCGGMAHMADEYAKVGDLYRGAIVLERFLEEYRFE